MLARRIVAFGSDRVYWKCRSVRGNEIWMEEPSCERLFRPNTTWGIQHSWHWVVTSYSERSLTFARDKLWAISGLAREERRTTRAHIKNEQYYAGLWKSTFLRDLSWIRGGRNDNAWRNPDVYIAPTWSWASHGPIHYPPPSISSETELAVVKNVHLSQENPLDPYGAVKDGWVSIEGHLRPVRLGWSSTDPRSKYLKVKILEDETLCFDREGMTAIDDADIFTRIMAPENDPAYLSVYCLPLWSEGRGGFGSRNPLLTRVWCLLLADSQPLRRAGQASPPAIVPTHAPRHEYQRVGYADVVMPFVEGGAESWLIKYPIREIIIR